MSSLASFQQNVALALTKKLHSLNFSQLRHSIWWSICKGERQAFFVLAEELRYIFCLLHDRIPRGGFASPVRSLGFKRPVLQIESSSPRIQLAQPLNPWRHIHGASLSLRVSPSWNTCVCPLTYHCLQRGHFKSLCLCLPSEQ